MILLTENEIKNLKPLDGNNCGSSGKCYFYKNGEVMKLLYYKNSYLINNVKDLLGLKIDDVSFPIDRTDLRKNYFAYTTPFIEGESLYDLKGKICKKEFDLSLSEISTIYNNAKEKVIEVADMGIQVNDANLSNILVRDNLEIGIIDVDKWIKNYNINNKNSNITHLNQRFYAFLVGFFLNDLEIINKIKRKDNENYVDEIIDYTHIKKTSIKTLGQLKGSFKY